MNKSRTENMFFNFCLQRKIGARLLHIEGWFFTRQKFQNWPILADFETSILSKETNVGTGTNVKYKKAKVLVQHFAINGHLHFHSTLIRASNSCNKRVLILLHACKQQWGLW